MQEYKVLKLQENDNIKSIFYIVVNMNLCRTVAIDFHTYDGGFCSLNSSQIDKPSNCVTVYLFRGIDDYSTSCFFD